MSEFIPVNEPLLNGNEKKYLIECIDTGWISSEGSFVKKFEEQFSAKVGSTYGIAVANGSVALEIAIAALDIEKDDEVIMPAFTIISCAAAIVRAGAKPVLVDSEPLTWNMDVNQIEQKITSKTKAIMVVHIYGLPVDMKPVLEIAAKYNLKIIEDAAEAIGQTYNEKPCGSFGDISCFSFYPNKHVTTGEGGMLVTSDEKLAERCRSLRNLCFQKKRFVHDELGWNFRMSNIQAAVGLAQLEQLDSFVIKKREIGLKYQTAFQDIKQFQLPVKSTTYAENIYWVFGIVLKENSKYKAEEIMRKLAEKKIGTRPFFYPMHLQPVFLKMGLFRNEEFPVAENIAERGFYVPSGLAITSKQIEYITKNLIELL
jgi:perosamine synthetase